MTIVEIAAGLVIGVVLLAGVVWLSLRAGESPRTRDSSHDYEAPYVDPNGPDLP
ncbi:MAG: hypothetical protein ACLPN5_11895 [Roseiarcus sp.]